MLIAILQEGFRSSILQLKKSRLGAAKQPVKTKPPVWTELGTKAGLTANLATLDHLLLFAKYVTEISNSSWRCGHRKPSL